MRKHSELLNICLVTNRGCNLRCKHCYIEPELLSSKEYISDDVFKLIYKRTMELVRLDKKTYRVNVESLGGEPTFIPYEFWDRNLPYAMEMAEKMKELSDKKIAFAFCSNMIISDERYYDLFDRYSDNSNFELFVPWEPDTQRFGSRDKLYKKYEYSLSRLKNSPKTLSLIPTKELISIGVDKVIKDHIIKHNFNDVSTDMLYQFGSGKEFFEKNMPLFSQVSQWYIDLVESAPLNVTISPYEEVRQSLTLGVPYHCMGNDHYDVEIEPDGSTSLNSSMTGSEAKMPSRPLSVHDDKWAIKLMFENTVDLDLKLNGAYDFCRQCEYQRFCMGGYYHYKLLSSDAINYLTESGSGDCPGYKKFWQHISKKHANEISPIYELNFKNLLNNLRLGRITRSQDNVEFHCESDLMKGGYESYFSKIIDSEIRGIVIDKKMVFSKTISQRLWFYDSLGVQVIIDCDYWTKDLNKVVENYVYGNYKFIKFSDIDVLGWCINNPNESISKDILSAISLVKNIQNCKIIDSDEVTILSSGLYVDARNTELFQWAYFVDNNVASYDIEEVSLTSFSRSCLENIIDYGKRSKNIIKIYGV